MRRVGAGVSFRLAYLPSGREAAKVRWASRAKSLALVVAMIAIGCAGFACFENKRSSNSWFFAGHRNQAEEIDELVAVFQAHLKQWQDPKQNREVLPTPGTLRYPDRRLFERNGCLTAVPGKASVLLMGNSHSASLSLGLRNWAKSMNVNFLQTSGFYGPWLYCFDSDGHENDVCETRLSPRGHENY